MSKSDCGICGNDHPTADCISVTLEYECQCHQKEDKKEDNKKCNCPECEHQLMCKEDELKAKCKQEQKDDDPCAVLTDPCAAHDDKKSEEERKREAEKCLEHEKKKFMKECIKEQKKIKEERREKLEKCKELQKEECDATVCECEDEKPKLDTCSYSHGTSVEQDEKTEAKNIPKVCKGIHDQQQ